MTAQNTVFPYVATLPPANPNARFVAPSGPPVIAPKPGKFSDFKAGLPDLPPIAVLYGPPPNAPRRR